MTDQRDNLDPVEALWRDYTDAERAGVFARTSLSATELRTKSEGFAQDQPALPAWVLHLRRRWVPIAAMLALAVTAWTVLFTLELGRLREDRTGPGAIAPTDRLAFADTVACLSGPGGTIDDRCRAVDLDTDHQVTLADFGVLQRTLRHRTN